MHVQNDAFFQFLKIFISYLTGGQDDLKKIKKSFLENMTCTICTTDIYIDALIINCGHTFCKYCVTKWLRTSPKTPAEQNAKCPLCNMVIKTMTPNMSARNHINELCEVFLDETGKKEREKSIQKHSEIMTKIIPFLLKTNNDIEEIEIFTNAEDIYQSNLELSIMDKQALSNASGPSEITKNSSQIESSGKLKLFSMLLFLNQSYIYLAS